MKFEYWKSKANGKHYFRLVAANGEKISSSEGYTRKIDALRTIDLIRNESAGAEVVRVECPLQLT